MPACMPPMSTSTRWLAMPVACVASLQETRLPSALIGWLQSLSMQQEVKNGVDYLTVAVSLPSSVRASKALPVRLPSAK